jgi:uncharacterized protein (DUF433 family)
MSGRRPRRNSRKKSEQNVRRQRMGRVVSMRCGVVENPAKPSITLSSLQNPKYQAWKEKLIQDPEIMGGETVFPNSRVTVRRIAALVERGEPPQVILEDYPHLRDIDLELAPLYIKQQTRDPSLQPV